MNETNESRPTDAIIALMLANDDLDDLDLIDALTPICAPSIIAEICDALEYCPMHHCDIAICADDEIADCAHLR